MSDIVERLRETARTGTYGACSEACFIAADEITRLRNELERERVRLAAANLALEAAARKCEAARTTWAGNGETAAMGADLCAAAIRAMRVG